MTAAERALVGLAKNELTQAYQELLDYESGGWNDTENHRILSTAEGIIDGAREKVVRLKRASVGEAEIRSCCGECTTCPVAGLTTAAAIDGS